MVKTKFKCEHCDEAFSSPQSRGRHRRYAHGIASPQAEANHRQYLKTIGRRDDDDKTTAAAEPAQLQLIQKEVPAHAERSGNEERDFSLELLAYTVGKLETVASEVAFQNGIPGKVFTRRCAEYLLKSSRR